MAEIHSADGVDLLQVSRRLRHKHITITAKCYGHVTAAHTGAALLASIVWRRVSAPSEEGGPPVNTAQRVTVLAGVLAFVGVGLHPPWEQRLGEGVSFPKGWAWLWEGPHAVDCEQLRRIPDPGLEEALRQHSKNNPVDEYLRAAITQRISQPAPMPIRDARTADTTPDPFKKYEWHSTPREQEEQTRLQCLSARCVLGAAARRNPHYAA